MNLKSGYPFWLIQSGLPCDYPRLTTSVSTDVVILGGGISGALAAYYLITNGIGCIVIDGRTIGLGSTSASTSLLQYEIDTPLSKLIELSGYHNAVTAYQLCRDAIYKLEDIADKIGFNDFQRKKSLYYAARKKDTPSLKEEFLTRKKNGFAVQWLAPDQLADQYNIKAPGAILSRDGAQTNAYLFTHALLQYGIKKGIRVFDRSPVSSIQNHKRGVSLTTQTGNVIKARSMIYANGYEVVDYIDKNIVKLKSTYATISQHMEESVPFWKNEVMIWNTADPYLYIRSTKDHRIIVGGRDEDYFNPRKRDQLLPKKTRQLVKDFKEVFPKLPFEPEFSWTGTFGSTKDGLPFIGKYSRLPHAYFSLGFGGNGITFSQIGAEIITGLILKNKNPYAEIFAFNRT
ncbi:MAG TPA: FAD-dependent oxidoreductase [Chitinophagales bacterium]|nr:FAD-dependent oxidoreductase [Chitinophagales bacterium]